jgi:hypothetical protein
MAFKGMARRINGVGAAVAAAATLLIAPGTAVAGDDVGIAAVHRITHGGTGRCLDSNSAGSVYTHDCNGTRNQQWDNYATGKFRNVATQRCLTSDGSRILTTTNCAAGGTNWATNGTTRTQIRHQTTGICMHNNGGSSQAVGPASCGSATYWTIRSA